MATRTSTPSRAGRTHQGVVRAIVAVTGVEDQVGDVIHPGIFTAALQRRWPKVVFHHNFQDFAGRVTKAEEWLPGDKRLPKKQPNGQPWPDTAGALVATMQFNLATERGREVFEWARFYAASNESAWSIGYTVPPGMSAKRGGVRHIYGIDVFEVSLVLHGANSLTSALEVKSAATRRELERKTAPMGVFAPALGRSAAQVVVEAKAHPGAGGLIATGLAVKATDTGRVLLLQRALDDDDPAAGRWEFPGGRLEDGEDPLAGATREWQEEVGASLPRGQITATWDSPNGQWRGFLYVVPTEAAVRVNADHEDRVKRNPDDPKGKNVETVAWWDVTTLPGMPALRDEMHTTPWSTLAAPSPAPTPVETKGDRSPIGSPGDRENWVDQVGGLPLYIREIAHALLREGHPEQQAIRMAVGAVQRWARGADNVKPDTIAKAAAALAQWEAKKAAAHADNAVERKSAAQVVAEAKALAPQEGKTMHASMGGSLEETLHKVREAVREHHTAGKKKGGAYCYVAVNATFPDSVVYTVTGDGNEEGRSYRAGYSVTKDGEVTLTTPTPVRLQVIAVDGGPAKDAPSPAVTLTDSTLQALREAAAAMAAAPLEVKHLAALAPAATSFLDVLSAKGMDTAALVYGDEDDDAIEFDDESEAEPAGDDPGPQIGVDIEDTPAEELEDDVEVKREGWGALAEDDDPDDFDEFDDDPDDDDTDDEDEDEDAVTVDPAEIDAELEDLRAA